MSARAGCPKVVLAFGNFRNLFVDPGLQGLPPGHCWWWISHMGRCQNTACVCLNSRCIRTCTVFRGGITQCAPDPCKAHHNV